MDDESHTGRRPFETPLLLVGVRCTARYIVLPAVLPLLGAATADRLSVATAAALGILLILDVLAVLSIAATLRRLWRRRHPRRRLYLPVALSLMALIAFLFVHDAQALYT